MRAKVELRTQSARHCALPRWQSSVLERLAEILHEASNIMTISLGRKLDPIDCHIYTAINRSRATWS